MYLLFPVVKQDEGPNQERGGNYSQSEGQRVRVAALDRKDHEQPQCEVRHKRVDDLPTGPPGSGISIV